jgi:hypothetical protein
MRTLAVLMLLRLGWKKLSAVLLGLTEQTEQRYGRLISLKVALSCISPWNGEIPTVTGERHVRFGRREFLLRRTAVHLLGSASQNVLATLSISISKRPCYPCTDLVRFCDFWILRAAIMNSHTSLFTGDLYAGRQTIQSTQVRSSFKSFSPTAP